MTITAENIKLGSQPPSWSERNALLPIRLRYLVSILDGRLDCGACTDGKRGTLASIERASSVDIDGVRRIPPSGALESGSILHATPTYEALKVDGDLVVALDGTTVSLRMNCSGVFVPDRGLAANVGELSGQLRVSASQECDLPTMRWLTRIRLFGVGRITARDRSKPEQGYGLSLDFYAPISFP